MRKKNPLQTFIDKIHACLLWQYILEFLKSEFTSKFRMKRNISFKHKTWKASFSYRFEEVSTEYIKCWRTFFSIHT